MSIYQALRGHLTTGFNTLTYLETVNANPKPSDRPSAGFVTMDFPGGSEEMASMGHAGANRYRVVGVAQVHIFTNAGNGPDEAEGYAETVAALFRGAKITTDESVSRTIHIAGVDPPAFGPGSSEGRYFRATIAFEYWYDNYA